MADSCRGCGGGETVGLFSRINNGLAVFFDLDQVFPDAPKIDWRGRARNRHARVFDCDEMTDNYSALDQLATDMMPDAAELAGRQRFLELGADDLALLRAVHPRLEAGLPRVIDAFYLHLQQIPELRALLGDAAAM